MTDSPKPDLGYDSLEEVRLQVGETVMVVPAGSQGWILPLGEQIATMAAGAQGMVMFTGRGVHAFSDSAGEYSADRHGFSAVERAVAVTRLRAWADIIENPQD